MRVGKIGHATVSITAGPVRCLMDPVLEQSFASDLYRFNPGVDIDTRRLCGECNLVVLSHGHVDHFSPRSLAMFARSVPVLYPQGDALIARALERLGFEHAIAYRTGQRIDFGPLTLVPTASEVPFPENGMLFLADGRSFWNLVDTHISEGVIATVREEFGRLDLIFANYQPFVGEPLVVNGLGADFPTESYSRLLRWVLDIAPRHVAPGSSGFWFNREWLNDRCFPVSEQQFEADVVSAGTDIKVVHVPHGGAVEVGKTLVVEPRGQHHVRRRVPQLHTPYDWRPERGVPPMIDLNRGGVAVARLKREVRAFLDHRLVPALTRTDTLWLEQMRRLEAWWCLEVIFPDGSTEQRALDLGRTRLRWSDPGPDPFFSLRTVVTASGLAGALDGSLNAYAVRLETRRMNRLYSVQRAGVCPEASAVDDPLDRVLMPGLEERYVERELSLLEAHGSGRGARRVSAPAARR